MKRKFCAALLLLALTSAVGCSSQIPENASGDTSQPYVTVQTDTDNTAETADTPTITNTDSGFAKVRMHENVNTFSTFLFDRVMQSSENENVLISPFSVYTALSMLENGAGGDTYTELSRVLNGYFNLDDEFAEFMRLEPLPKEQLNSFAKYTYDTTDKNVLSIANAFCTADKDYLQPNDEFMRILHDDYNSEFFSFAMDKTGIDRINAWVSDNTNGKITDLLDENSPIGANTAAVLLNAVSFDGKWLSEYDAGETVTDVFYNFDGTDGSAEYMQSQEAALYDEELAKGFVKAYNDGRFSFAVLMPNEDVDFNEYAYRLYTNDVFNSCIKKSGDTTALTYLPKLEFDYGCSLKEPLKGMGINRAFDEQTADFSNMFDDVPVFVEDVLHKTHIEVNEQGTQAQAATAVIMDEEAEILIDDMEIIKINRPFFFCIYDSDIKSPIFIGAVRAL